MIQAVPVNTVRSVCNHDAKYGGIRTTIITGAKE